MFVLKTKICLGYSGGRIVLDDAKNELATKYLSVRSSFYLIAMINLDYPMERYKFLEESGVASDLLDAKRKLIKFIPTMKEFVYELDEYLPIDKSKLRKIDIFRLTESAKTTSINEYRLAYPSQLVWVPTWKCNRSCLYCGVAKIKTYEHENRLPSGKVFGMLNEIIESGINAVSIHGGEPLFCYGDEIFDFIRHLTSNGVRHIVISTKNHISKDMAKKIWDSGLRELQLSLDAVDDDLLFRIYGEKGYLSKFKQSVQNLQDQKILINVNIVASTLNYKNIPALLKFLNGILVDTISMSPYRSGPINLENYKLNEEQVNWLDSEISALFDIFTFDRIGGGTSEGSVYPAAQRAVCSAGRTSLLFLPDGQGCYCDYLSEKESFVFGDLNHQTIKEIWESDALVSFIHPTKDDFEDTLCYQCDSLSHCIKMGLCFLKTPMDRKYGPDNQCIECYREVAETCH